MALWTAVAGTVEGDRANDKPVLHGCVDHPKSVFDHTFDPPAAWRTTDLSGAHGRWSGGPNPGAPSPSAALAAPHLTGPALALLRPSCLQAQAPHRRPRLSKPPGRCPALPGPALGPRLSVSGAGLSAAPPTLAPPASAPAGEWRAMTAVTTAGLDVQAPPRPLAELVDLSGLLAGWCDRAEHNEGVLRDELLAIGSRLRVLGLDLLAWTCSRTRHLTR